MADVGPDSVGANGAETDNENHTKHKADDQQLAQSDQQDGARSADREVGDVEGSGAAALPAQRPGLVFDHAAAVPHLRVQEGQFKDTLGRNTMLRGVNLGGSSKVPTRPNGATHLSEHFYDYEAVTFVGRPFPLEEAAEHMARLQQWGFNFLRFVVTWEAIEHEGPGIYDHEYLDYVDAILAVAEQHDINVYIDPHQDVWSRWTGGDGAPAWTLELVGFNLRSLEETGAATCHQTYGGPPEDFPAMIWPTNYFKLACATMFTLFWAGNDLAPQHKIQGRPVQEFLQTHYINAITQLAIRLRDRSNVTGFGTMNEPHTGYIGVADLSVLTTPLKNGVMPTPLQQMALGDGIPVKVGVFTQGINGLILGKPSRYETINPKGARAWNEGAPCVWREHGVWEPDGQGGARLLQPDYFKTNDFGRKYYLPFAQAFAGSIRSANPHLALFVELPPKDFGGESFPHISPTELPNAVNATHWYDGFTLFLGSFKPWFGVDTESKMPVFRAKSKRKMFKRQLAAIKQDSTNFMAGAPTLIGEVGIPYNMHNAAGYEMCKGGKHHDDCFSSQILAMDFSIDAMEANLLHYTLWNYTSDNCNSFGDQWNLEDLSIFSREQQREPLHVNSGGRALAAVARPYAVKFSHGTHCLASKFDQERGYFDLRFELDQPLPDEEQRASNTRKRVPLTRVWDTTQGGEEVRDAAEEARREEVGQVGDGQRGTIETDDTQRSEVGNEQQGDDKEKQENGIDAKECGDQVKGSEKASGDEDKEGTGREERERETAAREAEDRFETEIYVPTTLQYPQGFEVWSSPVGTCRVTKTTYQHNTVHRIFFKHGSRDLCHRVVIKKSKK